MKRLIASCDVYGQSPSFLYNGLPTCRTVWGGWISILVFACQFMGVVFVVWRYFSRFSSETNVNKIYVPDPEGFVLDKTTLPFAFSVQGADAVRFIDDQIYTTEVWYERRTNRLVQGVYKSTFDKIVLDTVTCDQVGLDPQYFRNLPLKDMICIKEFLNPTMQLRIMGEWESSEFGVLQIMVRKCTGPSCKPEAEIESKLRSGFFAVNYINYAVQSSNYKNPVSVYPSSYFTPISVFFSKLIHLRLANTEFFTDDSPFGYEKPKALRYTAVDRILNELTGVTDPNGEKPDHFLNLTFRMDPIKYTVSRVYVNLIQSFAELGGILKIIATISLLLTMRLSSVLLKIDLSKERILKESVLKEKNVTTEQVKMNKVEELTEKFDMLKTHLAPRKLGATDHLRIHPNHEGSFRPPFITLKKKKLSPDVDHKQKSIIIGSPQNKQHGLITPQKSDLEFERESKSRFPQNQALKPLLDRSAETSRMNSLEVTDLEHKLNKISNTQILLGSYLPFLLKKSTPLKQLLHATDEYLSCLDYIKYLELFEEVEKLKALVLAPDQLFLFSHLKSKEILKCRSYLNIKAPTTSHSPQLNSVKIVHSLHEKPGISLHSHPDTTHESSKQLLEENNEKTRQKLTEKVRLLFEKESLDEFDMICIEAFGFLLHSSNK